MKVTISQSFILSKIGIASHIRHEENGLPAGTTLYSEARKLSWTVKHRMLWTHAVHLSKRFPNETEYMGHIRFNVPVEAGDVAQRTYQNEMDLGYEYLILPVDHSQKPLDGEELLIRH